MSTGNERPSVGFEQPGAGSFTIGPLRIDPDEPATPGGYDFLFGPITVVTRDGARHVRDSPNGIEPLALSHFRDDLRTLGSARRGHVTFGDHDWYKILEFTGRDDATVNVRFHGPTLDLKGFEVATIAVEQLGSIVADIDAVEGTFGPLVGHCGCGAPPATYRPT